ncbi:unnamed protein product [Coregonus sp. 'balchen']|nr:unnamed protein product [Coregonus sp. 'balchen']
MAQGVSEMAALCVGLVGLMGAAAVTGMPMWKVTAFIGENIIVMETRWEGLGLLGALAGMRCTSCIQDNDRAKTLILRVAGGMQLLASICVFTPVSWMAHTIIRDFYNPLLIDAQRRELGEALYIGWVTGAVLFTSGLLFLCRRVPSASFDIYHPANRINKPTLMRYHPISSVPSMRANHQPGLNHQQSYGFDAYQHHQAPILHNSPHGQHVMDPSAAVDDPSLVENVGPLVYHHGSADGHHPSTSNSSNYVSSLSTPGNSLYISQQTNPYSYSQQTNPYSISQQTNPYSISQQTNPYSISQQTNPYSISQQTNPYSISQQTNPYSYSQQTNPYSYSHPGSLSASYNSSFQAVPQNPVFIGYKGSRVQPLQSHHSGSSVGVYI